MCGIAGILNLGGAGGIELDDVVRMVSILNHRGPDESGVYLDPHVGLGHARLSIIGLADGAQPLANEDDTLWIVYNGEAFNYLELKDDLVRKGHRFRTSTDTEVVLHLYEEYGPKCLAMINGQFALAIWNTRTRELFLARDRVGIRPLYTCRVANRFYFSSEIKALFTNPEVPRQLDLQALSQVFTFWTTLNRKTVFTGIDELPPGHYLTVGAEPSKPEPFWTLPYYPPEQRWSGSMDEAREELVHLVKDAVRLRLRADVPVGAYLSGGLDSSIITSLIARNFNNRLRTFSLSFQEAAFDETSYQQQLAGHLGTDHRQVLVDNDQIREHLPRVIWHSETPLLRMGPVPLYLLAGLVRENGFKVVLTGEGADEVFGGYNIFKEAKVRAFWARDPDSRIRPLLLQKLYPYIFTDPTRTRFLLEKFFAVNQRSPDDAFFSHRIRWEGGGKNLMFLSREAQNALSGYDPLDDFRQTLPSGFDRRDLMARAQYLEMELFLSNYLLSSQGDRVGMGHSIELRLPFLDYRVIDFAMRLPPHWKIRGLREKYLLKRAFTDILPKEIVDRPKQPYRAPIHQVFFKGGQESILEEYLSRDQIVRGGYFDPLKVANLLGKYRKSGVTAPSESQNMALMGILTTQILDSQFISARSFDAVKTITPVRLVCRGGTGAEQNQTARCG